MNLATLLEVTAASIKLSPRQEKTLRSSWVTWTANNRQGRGLKGAELEPLVRLGLLVRRQSDSGAQWRLDRQGNRKHVASETWYGFTSLGTELATKLFGATP
jgi:hypothetical protein